MKPLADHGTTARAKGRPDAGIKGCPCRPCRDAENRYEKRRRYLNDTGRTLQVSAEPVAAHLKILFAAGAGWVQLAAASNCSSATISDIRTGKSVTIRRATANKILAVHPGDALPPGLPVPTVGAVRRVRALLAIGHTCKAIYEASGVEHSTITELLNGRISMVARHVDERITKGYAKLAASPGISARSLNRATREGWAPPAAWDDIDDPDARPDWTGHCGTDRGWHVHNIENLPMCEPCEAAHQVWLDEHAHLGRQRNRELFAARAAASERGANLAENARELLRLDYTPEAAAERLGVTKNHLYQVLKRHPAPDTNAYEEAA